MSADHASETIRHGVAQFLASTMAYPPGKLDQRSVVALVNGALTTYGWCVREQMVSSMRAQLKAGSAPIDDNVLGGLIKNCVDERTKCSEHLGEIALFIAAAGRAAFEEPKSAN